MTELVVWDWQATEKDAGLLQNLRHMAFNRKMNSLPNTNVTQGAMRSTAKAAPAPASNVLGASFNPHDKPLDMNAGNHYVDFTEPAHSVKSKPRKPNLKFPGAGGPPPRAPAAAALPKVAAIFPT